MPPPYIPQALKFGNQLESIFRRAYGGATRAKDEIRKFGCLISSFNSLGHTGLAKSYHGTTSQVQFGANPLWTRNNPQCELADVLFVTFNQQQLRISFLQAKAKTSANPLPVRLDNTEQYFVLAHTPLITHWVGNVVWNNDILSSAILPSVGSFGIFHGRPGNDVGFHYVVADQLVPRGAGPRLVNGFLACSFNAHPPIVGRSIGAEYERVRCNDFVDFGAALISMEIGTPIQTQPVALAALRAWAEAAVVKDPDDRMLVQLLDSPYLQNLPVDNRNSTHGIGVPYVVVINSNLVHN